MTQQELPDPASEALPAQRSTASAVLEHLGLVAATFAGTVVAIRVLAVCGWDLDTAYVFLQEQGTAAVLIGTLIFVVPFVSLYFAFGLFIFLRFGRHVSRSRYLISLSLLVVGLAIAILSLPLAVLLAMALLTLVVAFAEWWVRRGLKRTQRELSTHVLEVDNAPAEEKMALLEEKIRLLEERNRRTDEKNRQWSKWRRWLDHANAIAFGLLIATYLLVPSPWLPLEQVGGDKPVVGWVLSQDEHQLVVLERDPRRAIQLAPNAPHTYCVRRPDPDRFSDEARAVLFDPGFVIRRLNSDKSRTPWCQVGKSGAPARSTPSPEETPTPRPTASTSTP